MLATVVTTNVNAAQVFFLVALILAAVVACWQFGTGAIQGGMATMALAIVALGLLFLA